MFSAENIYRSYERVLDEDLNKHREKLLAENIEIIDNSARTYHYKNDHLFWSFSFIKKWAVDLETAQVTVLASYYEPASQSEKPLINLNKHIEVFSQGKELRISEREKLQIPMETYSSKGAGNIVREYIRKGIKEIENAL